MTQTDPVTDTIPDFSGVALDGDATPAPADNESDAAVQQLAESNGYTVDLTLAPTAPPPVASTSGHVVVVPNELDALVSVDGADTQLFRIYPRDFWITGK